MTALVMDAPGSVPPGRLRLFGTASARMCQGSREQSAHKIRGIIYSRLRNGNEPLPHPLRRHRTPHAPEEPDSRPLPTGQLSHQRRKVDQCPADEGREVAFAGRSNAGKSSALNTLTHANLARTSKTPGRTQLLNFFRLDDERRWSTCPATAMQRFRFR